MQALVFGRKSRLGELKRTMGELTPELRPVLGRALGEANAQVNQALTVQRESIREREARELLERERLDVTLPGRGRRHGHRHLITRVTQEFCDVFIGMGYRIAEGPEVETEFYNFEALNIPSNHPSRSEMDTVYVERQGTEGEVASGSGGQVLLRTHTSPVQVHLMQNAQPPLYYLVPGRAFRKDTLDATHAAQFHQIEGLAVDRNITFGDLAGTLEAFIREYLGESFKIRLRPSFFPFTEPSAEVDVWWNDRWLEILGCGMVDPNVLEAVGYDPQVWQGFAFGVGVERIAMLRYGLDDIRLLYDNDIRFLAQF